MIEVVISHVAQETPAVRRIDLRREDGGPLPAFDAGAHIDLHLPNGLVRQYSLTNAPTPLECYQLGVLREPTSRGGSEWLHSVAQPGDRLRISAPRNLFPLVSTARRHLLFAAGIGITPILSMVHWLSAADAEFELYYSVRESEGAAFLPDLEALNLGAKFKLLANGRRMATSSIDKALEKPTTNDHIYVCGPKSYVEAVKDLAERQGWADDQVHREAFTAGPVSTSPDDHSFTVVLGRSGRRVTVDGNQTVIKALQAHGILVPVSCEQGICGTCLTGVTGGTPDHRDQYLTDAEREANNQFTPCCSRSLTPELVLDI